MDDRSTIRDVNREKVPPEVVAEGFEGGEGQWCFVLSWGAEVSI